MVRRVARALRLLLFAVGMLLAIWLPVSFFLTVELRSGIRYVIEVRHGGIAFMTSNTFRGLDFEHMRVGAWRSTREPDWSMPFLPLWGEMDPFLGYYLSLPLWLLAFICLAWPVTSFIVARRRRKGRGFEVEAKPGAALPPPES